MVNISVISEAERTHRHRPSTRGRLHARMHASTALSGYRHLIVIYWNLVLCLLVGALAGGWQKDRLDRMCVNRVFPPGRTPLDE